MVRVLKALSGKDWTKAPTNKQTRLVLILWGIGMICCVLSITNLFTEPVLQRRYFILYLLQFSGTLTAIRTVKNYYGSKAGRSSE